MKLQLGRKILTGLLLVTATVLVKASVAHANDFDCFNAAKAGCLGDTPPQYASEDQQNCVEDVAAMCAMMY